MLFNALLFILSVIVIAIYYLSKRKYDYWKKQDVPYLEPTAIFGNFADFILLKKHPSYVVDEICKKFPNAPYIGAFYGTEPTLIVKDPGVIKQVLIKDFYYFNGRETSDYAHSEFINGTLFFSAGDLWRVTRQNMTPVFTSAKMRNMFHLIMNCSHELERLLDIDTKVSNLIEARNFIARFTMACVTSCIFGIDSDTMADNHQENPFTKVGQTFSTGSKWFATKQTLKAIWPKIFYLVGLRSAPLNTYEFFLNLVESVFESRGYKPTSRNDFIDFILTFKQQNQLIGDSISNLKNEGNKKFTIPVTDKFMATQCFNLFVAGFDTSAQTTSYCLYELAKHPEAQKKCHEEVDAFLRKHGKLTYDCVTELPYTMACVNETLRFYPVLVNLTREVMEDYTLPTGVHLKKGVRVHIPVYHLHKDPKYFPEPEVFRPERFLGEEKQNIVPLSYMPFGEGPRICLGMRFAKMQVMAGLVTVLKKFEMKLDDVTPRKIHFEPEFILPTPAQPLKLKMTPREGWEERVFAKA